MPSWVPICKAMQKYCEAYFTAIEYWMKHEDRSILMNRLVLLETANDLFKHYGPRKTVYKFDLVCASSDAELLPEVLPSAGKHFVVGGDEQVFNLVKSKLPENLFAKAGIYFQANLLKALAGYNAMVLAEANEETRKSITLCVEKLLRLPHEAGLAHMTFAESTVFVDEGIEVPPPQTVPSVTLSTPGRLFYDFLVEFDRDRRDSLKRPLPDSDDDMPAKKRKSHNGNKKKNTDKDDGWITKHTSVGTQVAAFFPPDGENRKLFTGVVTKYQPDTTPGANDHLYHVLWSDGDEQDYDDADLEAGVAQRDIMDGWVRDHPSVGTPVAAHFPVEGKGRKTKIFKGTVLKYAAAVGADPALYHVVWEDGDEQDYDDEDFEKGVKLYERTFGKESASAAEEVVDLSEDSVSQDNINQVSIKQESIKQVSIKQESLHIKQEHLNNRREVERVLISESSPMNNRPARAPRSAEKPIPVSSSSSSARTAPAPKKIQLEEPVWVKLHSSIGTKVSAYFPADSRDPEAIDDPRGAGKKSRPKKVKPFDGRVTMYSYATEDDDEMFHVLWSDGDEEDYDTAELEAAVALYAQLHPREAQTKRSPAKSPGRAYATHAGDEDVMVLDD